MDGIFLIVEMDSDVIILWTMRSEEHASSGYESHLVGRFHLLFGIGDRN
jgi:hypothetical protein